MNENQLIAQNQIKNYISLNLEKNENKVKLYNALEGSDILLNDIVGQDINLADIYVEEINKIDEETGENVTKYRTILFDAEGKTYATGSYGVYNSIRRILSVFGLPHESWDTLSVKVERRKNKNGKNTLNLKVNV